MVRKLYYMGVYALMPACVEDKYIWFLIYISLTFCLASTFSVYLATMCLSNHHFAHCAVCTDCGGLLITWTYFVPMTSLNAFPNTKAFVLISSPNCFASANTFYI